MELLLNIVIYLPLFGALLLLVIRKDEWVRWTSLFITSAAFVLSLPLLLNFDISATGSAQYLTVSEPLLGDWDVKYMMGLDGLSMLLFMLTTFMAPIVVLSSWTSITKHVAGFYSMLLILQTGSLGVFAALDLFMFYIFFELTQIPMFFLIGIWGGKDRIYATVKFFIYTLVGWLLMLVALIYTGYAAGNMVNDGVFTTDWRLLTDPAFQLGLVEQTWLFLAFGFAFCIKVPIFPFHSWLPLAHTEAPTAGSVVLAAIALKMGTYAVLRYLIPLFPNAAIAFAPMFAVLGVIGIIYGALVAMVQRDVKKLVAYSSISHLGFVVLGMFAFNTTGAQGAIIQMVNHGLSTGALFIIVGMIYERRHTRMIADFGGIAKKMPVFTVMFMMATLASIGLPGLNGFVGEFLILVGTFQSETLGSYWYAIIGALGVILAAAYMLWMFQRVMFGPITNKENEKLTDINAREIGLLVPIMIFIVWIGIRPGDFTKYSEAEVTHMIEDTQNRAEVIAQNASAENIPGWAAKLYDITPQLASKTDNDQKENEL
ncbi:complex I subunit 4 family protein [Natronogracilivirga saccharolytica]|uniref:NADH-quinone oxidoreductase subunit M n=1 Tax=Natronogracilivirga saccharolytica TaxID=2812953 RepID=A0A8J7RI42_9BACT|nr:NADH-quinone oxidoreductase subunit M [Natronogracilivirga saccharolytica]MBP3192220.1 NADH-quinone oxidoreductase subunit M [Natronogracilivirga saccharolytica]